MLRQAECERHVSDRDYSQKLNANKKQQKPSKTTTTTRTTPKGQSTKPTKKYTKIHADHPFDWDARFKLSGNPKGMSSLMLGRLPIHYFTPL